MYQIIEYHRPYVAPAPEPVPDPDPDPAPVTDDNIPPEPEPDVMPIPELQSQPIPQSSALDDNIKNDDIAVVEKNIVNPVVQVTSEPNICLLYTSDAADDLTRVDLGGRRII